MIHGNHTASGLPMLTGDPHLGNSMPSFWIINQVTIRGSKHSFNVGAYVPGCPFIVLGANKHLWSTSTTNAADSTDVYEEKIEGDKYLFKNKWEPLIYWKEYLKVKGQDKPVELIIWSTHRGPILDYFTNEISQLLYVSASLMPDDTSKISI